MADGRAERLRKALEIRGRRKLYALAGEVGVNPSSVTRWLQGRFISLDHAVRLCDVLDVSLDWLMLGRGSLDPPRAARLSPAEERLLAHSRALSVEVAERFAALIEAVAREERGAPGAPR
jgi:transcriptional regulator with XRE-family HTH domain